MTRYIDYIYNFWQQKVKNKIITILKTLKMRIGPKDFSDLFTTGCVTKEKKYVSFESWYINPHKQSEEAGD